MSTEFYITTVALPEHYAPEHHDEFVEELRDKAESLSLEAAGDAFANAIGLDPETDEAARDLIVTGVDLVMNSTESNVTCNVHGGRWILVIVATGDGGGSQDGWDEMDSINLLLESGLLGKD